MHASALPILPGFQALLLGQAARRARPQVPPAVLQAKSLSQLRALFGLLIPDSRWQGLPRGPSGRQRLFTPLITFWAFLSQVLSADSACRTAVRKVQAWWIRQGGGPMSANTSAYCQARARLPEATLEAIHQQLAGGMESELPDPHWWRGHQVKVVEGTTCSMPDTAQNQEAYPQPSGQKADCGFPMLKLVGLFSLATGALLHAVHGPVRVHDVQLFRQLWHHLAPGDVLVADRGFCSFGLLATLQQRGVDGLMRLHQARRVNWRRGQRLGKADRQLAWTKPRGCPRTLSAEQFAALPDTLTVRQARVKVTLKGFRPRSLVLVTTLLDPVAYPAEALAGLYLQRWQVELHFRELKTLMRLDVLRCRSPQMIGKELLMHFIAYNLVRAVMLQAALQHQVALSRLSFKGTLDALQAFAAVLQGGGLSVRQQAALESELLRLIASDPVRARPDRVEPRAKKRRPKNYQLLTKPRHQFVLTQRRSRHKAPLT
ncbi:MAG: IS4 family transposase [Verrucomicrobia bacterium]|nr:IS4 family transposase [Verrucomicrobiota bacterium]